MGDKVLADLSKRLESVIEHVDREMGSIRAGRAKASLVEGIEVEAYGSRMSMREVANISVPDTTLIVINPWDKSLKDSVMKAVRDSGQGFNPLMDGDSIKVPIPTLTEERRKELVKLVAQKVEEGKVMVRQVRSDIKDEIEKLKDESGVSEDDIHNWLTEMQKIVDKFSDNIDELGSEKEKDLMTI